MYIHTYIHTYIDTYIHIYIHTYIHTDIQTDRHTYIHTCIQTYRQTYRHTYIPITPQSLLASSIRSRCITILKSLPSLNSYPNPFTIIPVRENREFVTESTKIYVSQNKLGLIFQV